MGTGGSWVFECGDLQRAWVPARESRSSRTLSIGRLFRLFFISVMFAPVSHFTKFPVEILEQIFLLLPNQDVIRMEAVRGAVFSLFDAVFDSTYLT